jgi:hypothetical protein
MTIILILIGMVTSFYLGYRAGYRNGHYDGISDCSALIYPRPKP